MQWPSSKGFSFIELLVSLSILSMLAVLSVPIGMASVQRVKERELRSSLVEIRAAIDAYKRASDEGRIPRQVDSTGYPPDLDSLVKGIIDQRDPTRKKIFFLRRLPRDPMHDNLTDSAEASWNKRSYASEANEPREGSDVYDVMSKSLRLGSNGIAYSRW